MARERQREEGEREREREREMMKENRATSLPCNATNALSLSGVIAILSLPNSLN